MNTRHTKFSQFGLALDALALDLSVIQPGQSRSLDVPGVLNVLA